MKSDFVKVLVLGGALDVGEELMHILTKEGFQAEVATSLAVGMGMVETGNFGLVVLDLNMFRGNEITLLRHLREKGKNLAVLALGDLLAGDPVLSSIQELVAGYLRKPVGKDELVGVIESIAQSRIRPSKPKDTLLASIGERIRAVRKGQSLTLKQVAERAHLSVSLLSQIERAESAASVSSLYKIASALNTRLQSFFEGY